MALKDVFQQYTKISQKEKNDMIFNIIMENCMGKLSICSIFIINNSIPEAPAAK